MPQFTGNANLGLENAGNVAFFSMGGSAPSMHNLNTLVLIDGRRVAFDPAEAALGDRVRGSEHDPPVRHRPHRDPFRRCVRALWLRRRRRRGQHHPQARPTTAGKPASIGGKAATAATTRSARATSQAARARGTTSLMVSVEGTETSPDLHEPAPVHEPDFRDDDLSRHHQRHELPDRAPILFYRLNPAFNAPPQGASVLHRPARADGRLHAADPRPGRRRLQPREPADADGEPQPAQHSRGLRAQDLRRQTGPFRRRHLRRHAHAVLGQRSVDVAVRFGAASPTTRNMAPAPRPTGFAYIPCRPSPTARFRPTGLTRGISSPCTTCSRVPDPDPGPIRSSTASRAASRASSIPDYSWEVGVDLNRYHLGFTSPGQINTANLNAALAAGDDQPVRLHPARRLPAGQCHRDENQRHGQHARVGRLPVPGHAAGAAQRASSASPSGRSHTREHLTATPDAISQPIEPGLPSRAGSTASRSSPFKAARDFTSVYGELKAPGLWPQAEHHRHPRAHGRPGRAVRQLHAWSAIRPSPRRACITSRSTSDSRCAPPSAARSRRRRSPISSAPFIRADPAGHLQ